MSPGPVENAAKVAGSTIDALKTTPLVLALVIFNVLFMLVAGYISIKSSDRWQELAETAIKACTGKSQ